MYVARYEELKGKRVLITGAASGIGLATAQVFANHGAKVFVVDYNKDAVEKVMAENPDFAGYSLCDVSKEGDVEAAFAKMDAKLGGIDVLISNAGISIRSDFTDITYEQWQKVIDINLNGMFLCAKEAAKRMLEQKSGVILMTASTNGTERPSLVPDYNASKAGCHPPHEEHGSRTRASCPRQLCLPGLCAHAYAACGVHGRDVGEGKRRNSDEASCEPEEIGKLYAFLALRRRRVYNRS